MASLISGYNYDIFISYRQKDNKYDGWVTEFVDNLKKELEAAFKEEISVYFDINPHDGLLETHDVDESLKEKLKCLVFIPIISRTYCDPESFAWEHEFKAFVGQASKDALGLKIKLTSGNVAGRVLPIQIYDLDEGDIKLCEKVLGGFLRGVDFIYAEPGVNRPLKPDDTEKLNLYKTKYRNQINKVGNALKDILSALKAESLKPAKENVRQKTPVAVTAEETQVEKRTNTARSGKIKILSSIPVIAAVIVAGVLLYPRIFKKDRLDMLRSSGEKIVIAVLPFQNMTNDTTLNVWQDGIQDNLINTLSNTEELKVRQTESISVFLNSKGLTNFASITPSLARSISRNLNADILISGSINMVGNALRVNTQLIDSKSNEVFKSFQIDGSSGEILTLIDSLSRMARNFLVISKIEKETPLDFQTQKLGLTNSPEAYRYFIYGEKAFLKSDNKTAVNMFTRALNIDSNYIAAAIMLPFAYRNQGMVEEAKKLCLKIYKKRDQVGIMHRIYLDWLYSVFFETPRESIKYYQQLQELDDKAPMIYDGFCTNYNRLHQYEKAFPEGEKAQAIYKQWGANPSAVWSYTNLGIAYHNTGQFNKEKKLYKEAETVFPDDPGLIAREAIVYLSTGDYEEAEKYLEKYIRILNDNMVPETSLNSYLGNIYSEAGIKDKAEGYYQKALSLEPDNPYLLNQLAYFLIDQDINIDRGLELAEKALVLLPDDNYFILGTKGWGLYKQGKYQEALTLLEKCDSLKPVYVYEIESHLDMARKAVAGIKTN